MAKFRIYNVQLLPNDQSAGEVGVAGYKKLFAKFRDATTAARSSKALSAYHRRIGRDGFFGPMEFHVEKGYVWGHFVRYTKTDQVDDLYTRQRLYTGKAGRLGVSTVKEILFLFDCKQHYFAIEEAGNSIPKPTDLAPMLEQYLGPIAEENFPEHELHVMLVADRSSLDAVLQRAVAFSRIEIDLTFPNGPTEDTLEQLKVARMQKFTVVASPGKSGKISKNLPDFVVDLLKGAMTYGKTKLGFYVPDSAKPSELKRTSYSSESSPLTFEKRQSANESDDAFAQRCVDELREVVRKENLAPDGEEPEANQ
jgi:hypothetical protein